MDKEKAQIKETKRLWSAKQQLCRAWKCTLQSLSVPHGRPDRKTTHKHIVWNDSHFVHLFQASNHTFFIFNIDCCFGSTCILGNLFCISCMIISFCVRIEYWIFHVNEAKTRSRFLFLIKQPCITDIMWLICRKGSSESHVECGELLIQVLLTKQKIRFSGKWEYNIVARWKVK